MTQSKNIILVIGITLLAINYQAQTLYVPSGTGGIGYSGNSYVGIGAIPDKLFTVKSSVGNTQIGKFADDARYIGIGRDEVAAFDLAGNPANMYLGGAKLNILTSGNVGIGTTNPGYKLDVSGGNVRASGEIISTMSSGVAQHRAVFGNYGFMLRNDGNSSYFLLTNSGDAYGSFNSLRPLNINNQNGDTYMANFQIFAQHSTGRLGIGTSSPARKLHVVGGGAQVDNLSIIQFGYTPTDASWMDASGGLLINYFSQKGTWINTAWALQTDAAGNTTATQDGGQVEMGAKVKLNNSLKIGYDGTNVVDLNTNIEVNQNANNASAVKVKTWNSSIKAFSIQNGTSINPFLVNGDGRTTINASSPGVNYFSINDVSNAGSPVQTFVVLGDGRTNIKTTSINAFDIIDASSSVVNFRVKNTGFVYAREVNVQTVGFPDYVFNTDYNLTPLNEVATYIAKNKHLKGFEKGTAYEKNGMPLGEVVRLQQEKIEELTLYLIELKKEVDALKK